MAIEQAKVADVITTFRPTRQFKAPPSTAYTSIDFDDSGEFLLLSRTDDTIQLYNTKAGQYAKELKSQKYGSALSRFTHHSTSIIYASTKVDHGIRYLSMHDNSFIRYFRGHTDRVTDLAISPGTDQFLSASLDNTVKLWDCRSQNAQGNLDFSCPHLVAYDPSGSVIAIASPLAQTILLYDLKNFDKPPFETFDLAEIERKTAKFGQKSGSGWTKMEFSNNGKYLLIATNSIGHYVLDAFSGDLVHFLRRPAGQTSHLAPGDPPRQGTAYTQGDATFTPDGRYVIGGNGNHSGVLVWDCQEKARGEGGLDPVSDLPCQKPVSVIAYNPRHNMIATADREVMMWLPDPDLA